MSWIKGLRARTRALLRGGAEEARMDEEFQFHVEMETERLVRAGVARDDARRRAIVAFGGMDRHREAMRDGRGARSLGDLAADVRYALRAMRRGPGFALAVALTLGVGIGVNGLVYGFVDSILFRPIPTERPEQLAGVFMRDVKSGRLHSIAYEDYVDYRDRSGAFAGLAGMSGVPLNLVAPGSAASDMVWGEMVTENFFTVLQMRPAIGRLFTAADAPQGANPFAVISYDSWRSRFHGDSAVVGRVVRINGTEFTITGVAPEGFKGLRTFGFWPEMWVPVGMHLIIQPGSNGMLQGRGAGWMWVVGRMHDGWDLARTQRAAEEFSGHLAATYPASNAADAAQLVPARAGFENPDFVKPRVLVLSSALSIFGSLMILLIIGANLANLQIARSAARAREVAIRLSLGCSRARLTSQLVIETLVLALPGLVIAALIVWLGPAIEPYMVPRLQFRVGIDTAANARIALFTAVVALAAILLLSLIPALRAGRSDLAVSLANAIGTQRRSRGRRVTLRSALVVSQLAMSVVLLVGGMLFVRSLLMARSFDLGFDPSDRVLLSVNVGLQGYDETRGRMFYERVLQRLREEPAVVAASWAFPAPFDTYGRGMAFHVPGVSTTNADQTVRVTVTFAAEDFVRALGLRLQDGRDFTPGDSAGAPEVMVVSRSLATRLWPGKNPIGQRARRGGVSGPEITVVGVTTDAKFESLGESSSARAYVALRQRYRDWQTLVVQARGDAATALPRLREIIASIDPALPTFGAITMRDAVTSGLSTSRTAAFASAFFGVLALLIASVGLYAVVANGVAERTREIGVRIAIGATPRAVLRHLMGTGARLGIIGIALGLVAAVGVAKLMGGLLYGLSPTDPLTFIAVPVALAIVVVIATLLPARRAVKLDPVAALRND
jgi:predicted permease